LQHFVTEIETNPHYAVASLIAKIMEVMVSLLKDNVAKAYMSSYGRTWPWWRLAAIVFLKG
jgi:hypothetical protein